MNKATVLGKHYIVEYTGCTKDVLNKVEDIKPLFLKAAEESKATILKSDFHQFEPAGVTGYIFIAESHFSIHTWPEHNYVAFDILTCGDMEPEKAINFLTEGLGAKKTDINIIERGFN